MFTLFVPATLLTQAEPFAPAGADWASRISLGVGLAALLLAAFMIFRAMRGGGRRRTSRPDFPLIVSAGGSGTAAQRPLDPIRFAPSPAAAAPVAPPPSPPIASREDGMVEGHTVRFYQPLNGTLQLLPGRLEVVEGEDRGQNIRFVRTGGGRPEITFGRTEGPPHRHVQLRSATVSREHARMHFEGEEWRISNLSRTNPVVVNGEELDGADGGRPLREGDRVEMGEITFVFRTG